MPANRPVHEIRFGQVKAAIWANKVDNGLVRHNVTLQRLYNNGEELKATQSFGRDDLALVAKSPTRPHTWTFQHGQDGNGSERNERF